MPEAVALSAFNGCTRWTAAGAFAQLVLAEQPSPSVHAHNRGFTKADCMRNYVLFFHLAGAIFWMGGMGFVLLALRPGAAATLQPAERLRLLAHVLHRFFWVVGISIILLLITGGALMAPAGAQFMPPGWHAMASIGVVMMLLFAYIVAAPYRRLHRAVSSSNWPEGARRAGEISLLVRINFALGWVAIAAVLLWR